MLRRTLLMTVRHACIIDFGHVVFVQEVVNNEKYGKQYVWEKTPNQTK